MQLSILVRFLFSLPCRRLRRIVACLIALLACLPGMLQAAPQDLPGQLYQAGPDWQYRGQPDLAAAGLQRSAQLAPTGGNFWHQADFTIRRSGRYVLDFKNSSMIGRFRHLLYDAGGRQVATLEGGIQSRVPNPFFMRHGREVTLEAGAYRLMTQLDSPLFLAQPEVYLDTLQHYQQNIKAGNAVVLLCLGVFLGLGFYYAALAMVRRRMAERMYALFILGNLLWNGMCLLVLPDLFGMRWIYLASFPILFSNVAYIVFVLALLEIKPASHPRLHRTGVTLLVLFGVFIALALLRPNWSLELDRYGVGLFMTYGLVAGIVRAREGNRSARLYLVAIGAFFMLGVAAISLARMDAYTIYIEHIGLLAVTVEVFLLALVLSYQFALLHHEKESALDDAKRSAAMAHTDALTGLPNRFRLVAEIEKLPAAGSLTIIDLDNLKFYNDTYGHARGDELLCRFASHLQQRLGSQAVLHRMGGDEFAITCDSGDLDWIDGMLQQAVEALRAEDFGFAGISAGSAHVSEAPGKQNLQQLADSRMYQKKQLKKRRVSDQPGASPAQLAE